MGFDIISLKVKCKGKKSASWSGYTINMEKGLGKSVSPNACRNSEYSKGRNAPSESWPRASSRLFLAIGDDAHTERKSWLISEWGGFSNVKGSFSKRCYRIISNTWQKHICHYSTCLKIFHACSCVEDGIDFVASTEMVAIDKAGQMSELLFHRIDRIVRR